MRLERLRARYFVYQMHGEGEHCVRAWHWRGTVCNSSVALPDLHRTTQRSTSLRCSRGGSCCRLILASDHSDDFGFGNTARSAILCARILPQPAVAFGQDLVTSKTPSGQRRSQLRSYSYSAWPAADKRASLGRYYPGWERSAGSGSENRLSPPAVCHSTPTRLRRATGEILSRADALDGALR